MHFCQLAVADRGSLRCAQEDLNTPEYLAKIQKILLVSQHVPGWAGFAFSSWLAFRLLLALRSVGSLIVCTYYHRSCRA